MSTAASSRDCLVVGGGLAGSLLANRLLDRGWTVDLAADPSTMPASRVGAGLITPVTGRKFGLTPDWGPLSKTALEWYRAFEKQFQAPLLAPLEVFRWFANAEEATAARRRRRRLQPAGWARPITTAEQAAWEPFFHPPHAGLVLTGAWRLDTAGLLDHLHRRLAAAGRFIPQSLPPPANEAGDGYAAHGIRYRKVVWCEGAGVLRHRGADTLPWKPSRGELLEVEIPGLRLDAVIRRGHSLIPLGDHRFLAGATYDWDHPDQTPTPEARAELESFLHNLLRVPSTITGHRAGVRVGTPDNRPVAGPHPLHPGHWICNGFGSKGSLLIPWTVEALAHHLVDGTPLPPELLPQRFSRPPPPEPPPNRRPTTLARQAVCEILRPGDAALDATAGNGHDTAFLARTVGPRGRVAALDIQPAAISSTRRRLTEEKLLDRVTLLQADHGDLAELVLFPPGVRPTAIMFNLGYLPGGDRRLITRPASTLRALEAALTLLAPGGILSVVAYPGHPGGAGELAALQTWLTTLPPPWQVRRLGDHPPPDSPHPRAFAVLQPPDPRSSP